MNAPSPAPFQSGSDPDAALWAPWEHVRRFLSLGAGSAGIAVAAGAFGAHALRSRVDPVRLAVFETGVRYQLVHALALIAIGLWIAQSGTMPSRMRVALVRAGWSFVVGTALFSGSLYMLVLSDLRGFGAVTPFGGVAFLIGWAHAVQAAREVMPHRTTR